MDMTHPSQYPLVAGRHAGKKVRCTPRVKPLYDRLYAHRGKNHWARIAIKELEALSTGLAGKDNIYIKPTGECRYDGSFFVFLPGLKATMERRPNDEFVLVDLELDENYFAATAGTQNRMGLYRATQGPYGWETKYVDDGKPLPKDGRVVTVADSGYEAARDAAEAATPRVIKAPDVPGDRVRREGCDLHFTPGKSRLGGLLRYNAVRDTNTYGSARLLAESMLQARSLTGVRWVSDHGGSSVLTQAMRILADKGVSLKGHTVYLERAGTSPGDAVRLAHRLEMNLNEAAASTGWNPVGAISQARVARDRLDETKDPYNKHYHTNAWINGVVRTAGAAGLVGISATHLGASIPMVASISAIVVSASSAVGATGTAYHIGKDLKQRAVHKLKR